VELAARGNDVRGEVRATRRALDTGAARLVLAEAAAELAHQHLAGVERLLQLGTADLMMVLQVEDDVLFANVAVAQARRALLDAVALHALATGRTLERYPDVRGLPR
jgi:outer membrane protein TolC